MLCNAATDLSHTDTPHVGAAPAAQTWIDFLLAQDALGWFSTPITLSSGQLSSWYINWRKIADDVHALDVATDLLLDAAAALGLAPDVWYGVPEGATRLALLTQFKYATRGHKRPYGPGSHVFSMGRGKPKEHGAPQDRHFLGYPQGDVIVLEDVTTTAGSLVRCIRDLQAAEVKVIAAVSMTDRSMATKDTTPPAEQLAALGVPFYAMSEAHSLLPAAMAANPPSDAIRQRLYEEYPALALSAQEEERT